MGQMRFQMNGSIVEEREDNRKTYVFEGTIKRFDKIVSNNAHYETVAISEAKARQNIIFQVKKKLGLVPYAGGIKLLGNIVEKESEEI